MFGEQNYKKHNSKFGEFFLVFYKRLSTKQFLYFKMLAEQQDYDKL